jgi:hypothetical protein
VFFDAEPDFPHAEAIHAIDLTEETPGSIVLLTPETKRSRVPSKCPVTRYRRFVKQHFTCAISASYQLAVGFLPRPQIHPLSRSSITCTSE